VSADGGVPRLLRTLTLVHAVLDGPFGLALLVSPSTALAAAGFEPDALFARVYGAALCGVAFVSWRVRDEGAATYRVVLAHKIAWAGCAALGCSIALARGGPWIAGVFAGTFAAFAALWAYWLRRLARTAQ